MFLPIRGNFLNLEQPDRIKVLRDSKLSSYGRFLRHLQSFRFNRISLLRPPTEGCNTRNLVQPWKFSLSIFENPVKSGVRVKFWESLKSMSFSFPNFCDEKISRDKKLSVQEIKLYKNKK